MRRPILAAAALAAATWCGLPAAQAADVVPAKPVRLLVPYAAGGGTDLLARVVGQKLSVAWGQQVVIDNRVGAGGRVATELTQRAADMYVSLELARSMNFYAAMCVADGRFDPLVAARAKLQIGKSGRHIAQESIQLHGGIGVTAEYPIAHYAARLTAIDQTLGSSTDQLRYLSGQVGQYGVAVL